jgi:hypothetical protein
VLVELSALAGTLSPPFPLVSGIATLIFAVAPLRLTVRHSSRSDTIHSLFFLGQGKSVTATVEDRCAGCAFYEIALSPAAFQQLVGLIGGPVTDATWQLN